MTPKLPFKLPQVNLGPRTRAILKYTGYTLFALFMFVFALQMSFPYSRVKDKLIEATADKYDITIGGVERGFMPGRVYFKAVSIRTRQTNPQEVVNTFYIDKLELDLGILSLIGGTISLDFDAQIGRGDLEGSISVGKFGRGDISAEITGRALPGDALPMRAGLGLPMTGKIEFDVDLSLPVEKNKMGKTGINWQKAKGGISLACPSGCTFGDGKTKLKPLLKNTRNQVMVGEGIDFGKVNLDSLVAKVSIRNGTLKLDKFDTKSKDGQLKIDYEMKLEKNFDESMVTGCLRFKGSDDLLKREPKTHAAISTTGAELRSDGLFHIRLTDRFKDMKRLNQECGPNGQVGPAGGGDTGGRPERPNLTVQPDEVAKPIPGPTMAAPPPATPPDQNPSAPHDAGAGSAAPPPTPNPTGAHEQPPGSSFEPSKPEPSPREGSGSAGTGATPQPPPEG
ncbi:MAG TPA: type II secretion system protein GspN [Kofleriaceae bacterium]|nr:type II secretion system protein GspN [Kofleriaceae bacterium]